MSAKIRFGATVNLYLDGQGFDCTSVCVSCDNSRDTQWKCPFAMGAIMPMREGDACCFRDGNECYKLAAKLDALNKAAALLKREIGEVKDQMEAAE